MEQSLKFESTSRSIDSKFAKVNTRAHHSNMVVHKVKIKQDYNFSHFYSFMYIHVVFV